MSWFHVDSGVLVALSWLPLIFDQLGWRRKKGQLAEASQLSVTLVSAFCPMRNDGISACEWRIQPLMDTCPLLVWLDKLGPDRKGLQLVSCYWNLAGQFTCRPTTGICVWAGLIQSGFVVKLPWAWLFLQNEEFCHGWYSWAFVVSWLWKNRHSPHTFCERNIFWEMSNLYFPWARDLVYVKQVSK